MPAAGYEIDFLRVSGLDRRNPLRAALAAIRSARAVRPARRLLAERRARRCSRRGYVAGRRGWRTR